MVLVLPLLMLFACGSTLSTPESTPESPGVDSHVFPSVESCVATLQRHFTTHQWASLGRGGTHLGEQACISQQRYEDIPLRT